MASLGVFAVVCIAYAAFAEAAWVHFGAAYIGFSFFPAAGVSLGCLVILPRDRWPSVLAAVVVAEIAVDLANGLAVSPSVGYAVANTVEPLVGALVVCRLAGRSRPPILSLPSRASASAFALGGLCVGPFVGALIGATVKWLSVGGGWPSYVASWWVGDALGVLAAGSTIVVLADPALRRTLTAPRALLVVVGSSVASVVVLRTPWLTSYLAIPLLLILAFFAGMAGIALGGLVTAVVANVTTAVGVGAFSQIEGITPQQQLVDTQLLIAAALVAAYLVSIEVAERERADRERLLEHEARLRAESMEAVGALSRELVNAASVSDVVQAFLAHVAYRLSPRGAAINLLDEEGQFHELRSSGVAAEFRPEALGFTAESHKPGPDAVRTGSPVLLSSREHAHEIYPELGPLAEMSGAHSLAAVPLARRLGPTGYLLLFWDQPRTFDTAERAYLASLGDVVGQSMDRVLLREREQQLAVELQHAMLGVPDEIVEVDVATAYRPADSAVEIGGDWYDVVRLSETRTAFIVGDVVGHNLAAAKAMGQIRIAIRTLAPLFPDPAELLARLDPIVEEMDGASPTTLIYAVYDATTRRVVFACAGHPPPLVVHRGGGSSFLEGGRGIALGIIADADRPVATTTLRPGDALILYTDGLIERRGEPIEAGLARLAGVVDGAGSCDPERLRDDLLEGLASVEDDVAVLVVRPWEMPFRVRIDADPQQLRDVRTRLREWLFQQAVAEGDVDDVLVSSGEAVANAVEHAYLGHLLGDVDVRADLRPDPEAKTASLDVRVTDRGSWRRPPAEGPRGNGQKLMRALADDVRVRSDGAGTAVQLRYTVHLEDAGAA